MLVAAVGVEPTYQVYPFKDPAQPFEKPVGLTADREMRLNNCGCLTLQADMNIESLDYQKILSLLWASRLPSLHILINTNT